MKYFPWRRLVLTLGRIHKKMFPHRLKTLVNKDTLLRTHCCPWCFLGCANWETFVADAKCFWTKSETFLCPGHKIRVRNKCCASGQTGKHLCRQQCIRNNVSSFARALREAMTFGDGSNFATLGQWTRKRSDWSYHWYFSFFFHLSNCSGISENVGLN